MEFRLATMTKVYFFRILGHNYCSKTFFFRENFFSLFLWLIES